MKTLLHACCGPCSLEPVRLLQQAGHDLAIAFANSNIQPRAEYDRRLQTLRTWALKTGIAVHDLPYDDDQWRKDVGSITQQGGPRENRCRACYRTRLDQAAAWAAQHGFEALGTTLTVSPYQYTNIIGQELRAACEPFGLTPVFEDFRPFYAQATRRSRELGMYRQNYCGCPYSQQEAADERAQRSAERAQARQARERELEQARQAKAAQQAAFDARQHRKRQLKAAYRAAHPTTDDFDYDLPPECIAQQPAPVRDACRLLVMDRHTGALADRVFSDIVDYVQPGDVLVANETRVLPARLLGAKRGTGGAAEVLLLRETGWSEPRTNQVAFWEALVKPGKRLKPGAVVDFYAQAEADDDAGAGGAGGAGAGAGAPGNAGDSAGGAGGAGAGAVVALSAQVLDWALAGGGGRIVRLSTSLPSLDQALHAIGRTPLPPYIRDYAGDDEMYQTVYAQRETSAAAPTAGLHFTPELIARLQSAGAHWCTVELQVGLDTFRVVEEADPTQHKMHTETYSVPQSVVDACNQAHERGNKVIAVGTTTVRSLESAWLAGGGQLASCENAQTNLFLLPGAHFNVVDALITNFHVPRSTLMMLVSAFSSREHVMAAYHHAIASGYRLLSFGDAMLIH